MICTVSLFDRTDIRRCVCCKTIDIHMKLFQCLDSISIDINQAASQCVHATHSHTLLPHSSHFAGKIASACVQVDTLRKSPMFEYVCAPNAPITKICSVSHLGPTVSTVYLMPSKTISSSILNTYYTLYGCFRCIDVCTYVTHAGLSYPRGRERKRILCKMPIAMPHTAGTHIDRYIDLVSVCRPIKVRYIVYIDE